MYRALALTLAALLVPAAAEISAAQQAELQQEVEDDFERLDSNNDTYVDSKELEMDNMAAEDKADLMEHDADKDGKLSKSEMLSYRIQGVTADQQAMQQQADDDFKELDADTDGFVDSKELEKANVTAEERVELMEHDADKDGKLSKSEVMSFYMATATGDAAADEENTEEDQEDDEEEGEEETAPSLLEVDAEEDADAEENADEEDGDAEEDEEAEAGEDAAEGKEVEITSKPKGGKRGKPKKKKCYGKEGEVVGCRGKNGKNDAQHLKQPPNKAK